MRKLLVIYLLLINCFAFGQSESCTTTGTNYQYCARNDNGNVQLVVFLECFGTVRYRLILDNDLKEVEVSYDGGPYHLLEISEPNLFPQPGGGSIYDDNQDYEWAKTYSNSTPVDIAIKYKYQVLPGIYDNANVNINNIHHLSASGVYPQISYDVIESDVPNTFEFIYTGDDLLTAPGVSSYSYKFHNGSFSHDSYSWDVLTPASLIPGANSNSNPIFYCQTAESDIKNTFLEVTWIYDFPNNAHGEPVSLSCESKPEKPIVLKDLCTYFSGPSITSVPVDEFDVEVQTSSCSDSDLEAIVNSHNLTFQSINDIIIPEGPVAFNQTSNHSLPSNSYLQYHLEENIVIEEGCACQFGDRDGNDLGGEYTYDPSSPCNNMSQLTFTQEVVNGEIVYTFNPSQYQGGASVSPVVGYDFDFGDGSPLLSLNQNNLNAIITNTYQSGGYITVTQTTHYADGTSCQSFVSFGGEEYCCVNFAPESTERYWLSAWVKEEHPNQVKTYDQTAIKLVFSGGSPGDVTLRPTGDIIEGWQRIVGEFSVPSGSTEMDIELINESSLNVYFDDVRVHPFNASMKSYVYDPETLWLTAELDDNNYATFYEYDQEGQLIRIKKETARGIMTIQESRSSNPKQN